MSVVNRSIVSCFSFEFFFPILVVVQYVGQLEKNCYSCSSWLLGDDDDNSDAYCFYFYYYLLFFYSTWKKYFFNPKQEVFLLKQIAQINQISRMYMNYIKNVWTENKNRLKLCVCLEWMWKQCTRVISLCHSQTKYIWDAFCKCFWNKNHF